MKDAIKRISFVNQVEPLKPGERVEAFKVYTLDGNASEVGYTDTTRKCLLFVLSTSCPHCEKTIASWRQIAESDTRNICNIFGVSLQPFDETKRYLESKNVGFYLVSAETSFSRKYKVPGVPETILLQGNGIVQKTWLGELSTTQVDEIQVLMGVTKTPN